MPNVRMWEAENEASGARGPGLSSGQLPYEETRGQTNLVDLTNEIQSHGTHLECQGEKTEKARTRGKK